MPLHKHKGVEPRIGKEVFIAPSADIIGDVIIGDSASIWYNTVLRGDIERIEVGVGTNIQDGTVVHVDWDVPTRIGDSVTVGHQAVIHACEIGDACLIGMGAVVLSEAKVGEGSIIGAGAVVVEGAGIPPHSLVLGVPGKVVKTLDDEDVEGLYEWAERYCDIARDYLG